MTRIAELQRQLAKHGYTVETWRPGDGKTRYKICPIGKGYHETDGITVAFGLAEFRVAVDAFLAGLAEGLRQSSSGIPGVSGE